MTNTDSGPKAIKARNRATGQYTYQNRLDRVCVCGARLGDHSAEAPHDYEWNDCPKFRPAKEGA